MAIATEERGGELLAFRRGAAGVLYPNKQYFYEDGKKLEEITGEYVILTPRTVDPHQGGSIILNSRANPIVIPGAMHDMNERYKELKVDIFLPIGGDDSAKVTYWALKNGAFSNVKKLLDVSKTIDNDKGKIDFISESFEGMINIWTPGFPSAVRNGREIVNFLYSTAYTHERVMWIEAMGRKAGYLALAIGNLGLAHRVIIPESPISIEEECENSLRTYIKEGFFVGIISEGAINANTGKPIAEDRSLLDPHGNGKLGGAAKVMAEAAKRYFKEQGKYAPYFLGQIPEHLYRGGPPTELDREAAIALGYHAVISALDNADSHGHMAVLRWDGKKAFPATMPLEEAVNIDPSGKIIPRVVPIDENNPENGFYNLNTKSISRLGQQYVGILGIPQIKFQALAGEVHK